MSEETQDEQLQLAAFVREAGQWGLQLFGDEVDKHKGDFKAALVSAKKRFNLEPNPPRSAFLDIMKTVHEIKACEEEGIEMPSDKEIAKEEEANRFGPKPTQSKVKPSPFEKEVKAESL